MKQRPILVAVIGYIIGILWGLYFRFSIALFYIPIIAIYYIFEKYFKNYKKQKFKLLSFSRYSRYIKLVINSKVIFILIIFSIISNSMVLFQNNQYENCYQDGEKIQMVGIIVSQKIEKQYYVCYQIKVLNTKRLNLYIQVNKGEKELEYGDKIEVKGEYREPSEQKNHGGYNDKQYLKTLKISGRVKVSQIEIIAKKQQNIMLQLTNGINLKIKEKITNTFDEEKAGILKGLLLGEIGEISEEVKENFQIANISHVLAISGMHISYIIMGIQMMLKNVIGKRKTKIVIIFVLIGYIFITGFSPSIMRAVIMGMIAIGEGIGYRKSDIWNAIAVSLLVMLFYNPFLILNVGLQLSYLGTIGMIGLKPIILQILENKKQKREWKAIEKIKEMMSVTLSAQIMIFPVMLYHFNIIGIYFLITNLLVSIIIGPLIILGFFVILVSFIFPIMIDFFQMPFNIGLEILDLISSFSELPFSKIYIPTPNIISIILYFLIVGISIQIYPIYSLSKITTTQKRVKNLIALFQYKLRQNKKKCLKMIFFVSIVLIICWCFPKKLKIYFADVGQGDCTFIVTPRNKTILIDGGGSLTREFDVGKKILIPYLLDRGYVTIDYVIISHFDRRSCSVGLFSVMKELKVKNVIIGKQFEDSENYQEFIKIVKENKIKVIIVEAGNRIKIENSLYFDVLWPSSSNIISENVLNNNALVGKLQNKDFAILFTGDIEKEAEDILIRKYQHTDILKANILKVAHHGSNSSSTETFLRLIAPEIALIGVGENNLYGHPNREVLQRLESLRY